MIVLISLFISIYLRKKVLERAQEHWLLMWVSIENKLMNVWQFVWNRYIIRLDDWYCWLVYSSKYTWERIYSGEHMYIYYLNRVSIKNESMNAWFYLCEMEMLSGLMNNAVH